MEHLAHHTKLCLVLLDSNCDVCSMHRHFVGGNHRDVTMPWEFRTMNLPNFRVFLCSILACHDALKELVVINSCKYDCRLLPHYIVIL